MAQRAMRKQRIKQIRKMMEKVELAKKWCKWLKKKTHSSCQVEKYSNWNKNFTREVQEQIWAGRRKNQWISRQVN